MDPDVLRERLNGFDWSSLEVAEARWSGSQAFDYDEAWTQTDLPVGFGRGSRPPCPRRSPLGLRPFWKRRQNPLCAQ